MAIVMLHGFFMVKLSSYPHAKQKFIPHGYIFRIQTPQPVVDEYLTQTAWWNSSIVTVRSIFKLISLQVPDLLGISSACYHHLQDQISQLSQKCWTNITIMKQTGSNLYAVTACWTVMRDSSGLKCPVLGGSLCSARVLHHSATAEQPEQVRSLN